MQGHEQQIVSSHTFPAELSQWFTTPFQQTPIVYTSPPTNVQPQNERPIQIPIMDKSGRAACETTDVAFVGYVVQPNQDQHQTLGIQNIPVENITHCPRTDMNPNDYLSVVMVEPRLKDAATNTDERWDAKKVPIAKRQAFKSETILLKPKITELTVLEERSQCHVCMKDFPTVPASTNLDHCSHIEKSDCINCGKKCVTSSHLSAHKCVEKLTDPTVCQFCNIYFSNHEIFVKHKESHLLETRVNLTCNFCGLEFSDLNVFEKHTRIHSAMEYLCNVCDKNFSSNASLMSHKRVHCGDRLYQCDLCSKRFFTKSHAQTHRRVHSGERPFSCNFCGRAFADASSFRRHQRLHQQNKKYQCEVCRRGFPLAISLSKHLAKHHSYT